MRHIPTYHGSREGYMRHIPTMGAGRALCASYTHHGSREASMRLMISLIYTT